jgi:20S proteasome alpha/beta subunit
MTLIVALRGKDGMALAADSRGTIGDPRGLTAINDSYTKLFRLSQYCGIGISGASELAAKIVDELTTILAQSNLEFADQITDQTRNLIRARYDDWFAKFEVADRPAIGLIIAGLQRAQDAQFISRTYMLASPLDFAPQLFPSGNCLSGVPQYAVYLMHRLYNPEMTVSDLSRLAAYLIAETATQDPKVGGPIRIATIKPDSGYEDLDTNKVEEIVRLNNEQNEKLKQFFFGGGDNEG